MWNDKVTVEVESEDGSRITCTSLGMIERMVARLQKDCEENPDIPQDHELFLLPFEYIIGSLFPNSYESVRETMTKQYIDGYKAGFEDGLKEGK